MQREMLSHFITLSNKLSTRGEQTDGTSTCTRQVKKYSQNDKNGLFAWMMLLLENKWWFGAAPLLGKSWNSGFGLYSRNPEKPRKLSWNGRPPKNNLLGFCTVPQCPALPLKKTPLNSANNTARNPAKNPPMRQELDPCSISQHKSTCKTPIQHYNGTTKKNCVPLPVLRSPPKHCWNCCWNADKTTAEMLIKLLLKCQGNTLSEQALEVPGAKGEISERRHSMH